MDLRTRHRAERIAALRRRAVTAQAARRRQISKQLMEPLWSPVDATGGNRWQIGPAWKLRKQAKTMERRRQPVATDGNG
jgi:hypothetical protein